MTKLAGYRKFVSKKNNKNYCVAFLLHDVSDRDKDAGFIGQKIEEVFLPPSCVDLFTPGDVGKQVFLDYEITNGNAFLRQVSVK